jgi:hypothetical protein
MDPAKLVFRAHCGNGHTTQQIFTREALEPRVAFEGLVFHCGTCGASWRPSAEERVRLRALARAQVRKVLQ